MSAPVIGYRAWAIDAPKVEVDIGINPRRRSSLGSLPMVENPEMDAWMERQTVRALGRRKPALVPLSRGSFWRRPRPVYTTECPEGHEQPTRACQCGIYAWSQPAPLRRYVASPGDFIAGAILAWGHLVVHGDAFGDEGFRAQHCRIVAFAQFGRGGRIKVLHEAVSERYGAPLIPAARLRQYASEFGVELLEATHA